MYQLCYSCTQYCERDDGSSYYKEWEEIKEVEAQCDLPLTYRWDFNNDGVWDTGWSSKSSARSIDHEFVWLDDWEGSAKVEVKVTAKGESVTGSDTAQVTIYNSAPIVHIYFPFSTLEPFPDFMVQYSDSFPELEGSFCDAGKLDTHTVGWNFNDGSPKEQGIIVPLGCDYSYGCRYKLLQNHRYLVKPGGAYYVPVVTVIDDDGSVGSPQPDDLYPFAIRISKEDTILTFTSRESGSVIHLKAQLSEPDDELGDLNGKAIIFTIGEQSVTALTNADGIATATLTLEQVPEVYTIKAIFAGDDYYLPSSDSHIIGATTVTVIDFEEFRAPSLGGLGGFEEIGDYYHSTYGVTFLGAESLSKAEADNEYSPFCELGEICVVSIDDFRYSPPRSGDALAGSGYMIITFDTSPCSVGGYFTSGGPLTFTAYDASGNIVGTNTLPTYAYRGTVSIYEGIPNYYLNVDYAGGIKEIVITGEWFYLDDLTFGTRANVELVVNAWTPGGHFILDTQDWTRSASVPLHVEILAGVQPVEGATIIWNGISLGQTDADGRLEVRLPILLPPIVGPFTTIVEAQYRGASAESDRIKLYDCWRFEPVTATLNFWQSLNWNLQKWAEIPSVPGEPTSWTVLRNIAYDVFRLRYVAEVGDVVTVDTYKLTSLDGTDAWLLREIVERDGSVLMESSCWTESLFKFWEAMGVPGHLIGSEAIGVILASPAVLYVTAPDGSHAGYDPSTSELVVDFPIAISDPKDEPFRLFITQPNEGEYLLTVVGTDSGSYTLSVQALDSNGIDGEEFSFTNSITEGKTHEYDIIVPETGDITVAPQIIPATIDFDPSTLNLQSKGKWVTTYIELLEGYDASYIDVSSIRLNDEVQAEDNPTEIGDYDGDGIADLMVKFDRSAVQEILEVGDEVVIKITGDLTDGIPFEGSDTIRVIDKGKVG